MEDGNECWQYNSGATSDNRLELNSSNPVYRNILLTNGIHAIRFNVSTSNPTVFNVRIESNYYPFITILSNTETLDFTTTTDFDVQFSFDPSQPIMSSSDNLIAIATFADDPVAGQYAAMLICSIELLVDPDRVQEFLDLEHI